MPRLMAVVLALLIVGCTTATPPVSPSVQTVCEDAATQHAVDIAALAAKHKDETESQIHDEFVAACVSQLTADLQQIPADLAAILANSSTDAGADR